MYMCRIGAAKNNVYIYIYRYIYIYVYVVNICVANLHMWRIYIYIYICIFCQCCHILTIYIWWRIDMRSSEFMTITNVNISIQLP